MSVGYNQPGLEEARVRVAVRARQALVVGGLMLVCLGPLQAQTERSFEDPRFLEALRCLDESKFAKAREIAERMLAQNPRSYTGAYVMGRVFYYGEGSVPRAYYCFRQARDELELIWGKKVPNNGPWPLHRQILVQLVFSAGQLERYEEELQLIKEFSYEPGLESVMGWPLMKLGRVDEARQLMKKEVASASDPRRRRRALNTLGSLELETGHVAEGYDYFLRICREFERDTNVDPVCWSNAGEAARALLRYDEAEKLFLQATERFDQHTYSAPWASLADLYVSQGRLAEAVQALKQMQIWRLSSSPRVSQNQWAETLSTAGIVLLSLGYDKEAYHIFARLANRPDRNSSTSTRPSLVEGRQLYFYSLALRAYRQRLLEERSWSEWKAFLPLSLSLWQVEQRLQLAETRAGNLLSGGTGIVDLLRPYGSRSLDCPRLAPGLWRLFGTGPVAVAVRSLIGQLKPTEKLRHTYLAAVLGETLAVRGHWHEAETTLDQALQDLPPREFALRARLQANLIRVLEGQGRTQEALHHLRSVMESDPSLLRQFELPLPIQWSQADGLAAQAISRLQASPRFRTAAGAFTAEVQNSGEGLSARVLGPDGTVLKHLSTPAGKTPAETLAKFCQAFHDEVFAPPVDLSRADIYSIDGSCSSVSSKQLQEVIKN